MARETWVQSQVESYQRLKKWYLMPPCLTLSIIRYGSRIKWSNPEKGVAPSTTPRCSKLSKRESSGHSRLWSPTLLTIILLLWEFFTPADGLLLEFEWQNVSSSFLDSSQYSDRFQQCCSLDGLYLSSDFEVFSSLLGLLRAHLLQLISSSPPYSIVF